MDVEIRNLETMHLATVRHVGPYFGIGEAFQTLHQLVRQDPGRADAWNDLGWLYAAAGRYPQASGYFQRALALEPDHPQARENLERARARTGEP